MKHTCRSRAKCTLPWRKRSKMTKSWDREHVAVGSSFEIDAPPLKLCRFLFWAEIWGKTSTFPLIKHKKNAYWSQMGSCSRNYVACTGSAGKWPPVARPSPPAAECIRPLWPWKATFLTILEHFHKKLSKTTWTPGRVGRRSSARPRWARVRARRTAWPASPAGIWQK